MKMLPSQLLMTNSSAEKAIFGLLRSMDLGRGAVALHSLNLPKHDYKQWAEADFIVICERGLLLIEVKGGRVACRDGVWEFTNRYGEVSRKTESPATQAKTAFFALRDNYLHKRFGGALRTIPMGWAVAFTDIERLVLPSQSILPDQPDEISAYKKDCVGPNNLSAFIHEALSYWSERTSRTGQLSQATIGEITAYLRPSFEQVPPLANRLDEFGQGLAALTTEQYARLDDIQENDRILVRGGAGTGKTFLAMASARYDNAEGREVVVVTRSEHLVQELKNANPPPGVDIETFCNLPAALHKRGRPWGSLIVDEGQDLCQPDALNVFEHVVDGGIQRGRWRWFGDTNRQVSESFPIDDDVLNYLSELSTKCRLQQNVRNAPKIVEAIVRYAGADAGSPSSLGSGSEVVVTRCEASALNTTVAGLVRSWVSGQGAAARSDVAVLLPNEDAIASLIETLNQSGVRAERLLARPRGKVRDAVVVATVEDFKGLERPLVCVAGLTGSTGSVPLRSVVYRSFSRANHTLALVCTELESEQLAKLAASFA